MSPEETPPDEPTLRRLKDLVLEGQNLRGLTSGPQPEARLAFRKSYLGWHDQIARILDAAGLSPADIDLYRNTAWQLVATGQISDDELVRTVLGDIDFKVGRLDQLAHPGLRAPERAIPDPTTVGVAIYDANCCSPNTPATSSSASQSMASCEPDGAPACSGSPPRTSPASSAATRSRTSEGGSSPRPTSYATASSPATDTGSQAWRSPTLATTTCWPPPSNPAPPPSSPATSGTSRPTPSSPTASRPQDSDTFLLECIDANPVLAARLVTDAPDPEQLLANLDQAVPNTAARLRALSI